MAATNWIHDLFTSERFARSAPDDKLPPGNNWRLGRIVPPSAVPSERLIAGRRLLVRSRYLRERAANTSNCKRESCKRVSAGRCQRGAQLAALAITRVEFAFGVKTARCFAFASQLLCSVQRGTGWRWELLARNDFSSASGDPWNFNEYRIGRQYRLWFLKSAELRARCLINLFLFLLY